jgi:hypothetical protein
MKKVWMKIINWLFGQSKVDAIIEESEDIVYSFSKLEDKFTQVNAKITNEIAARRDLITKFEKENAMLGLRQSSNNRIAQNINKLLNGEL